MYFEHKYLMEWIPSTINISEEEYLSKFKCYKCKKDLEKYKDKFYEYKIDSDIVFDVYYWLNPNHMSNSYSYSYSETALCYKFNCNPNEIVNYAKEIGIVKLVNLSTYHSVWLHYFHHFMQHSNSCVMEEWDTMYQSKHVHAKNELHFLIYLLLTDEDRKSLMKEIRDFSLCPPIKKGNVCGYDYLMCKISFEERTTKLSPI
jgi:hypothetical protein